MQDPRTRPTAKYLQQHKFTSREAVASAAVRALLPLVQQARTHMAEVALMAGIDAQQAGPADDGAFSWHDPRSTLASPAGGGGPYAPAPAHSNGTLAAAHAQHLQAPAAYQQTVAAAGGGFGVAAPPAAGEASGTMVVRQSADEAPGGWGATVVSPAGPPASRGQRRVGE